MTNESQELKLYEEIKKSFVIEKGQMLMLEWDIAEFSQLRSFLSEDLDRIREKVSSCTIERRPFAILDFIDQEEVTYTFEGRTFKKVEVLKTGEVLDFYFYGEKVAPTAEEIKKEFEKLKKMLNSKAS